VRYLRRALDAADRRSAARGACRSRLAEASAESPPRSPTSRRPYNRFLNPGGAPMRSTHSVKPCIGSGGTGRPGIFAKVPLCSRTATAGAVTLRGRGLWRRVPPAARTARPLSAADGTGPGDRAVLAVHALRMPRRRRRRVWAPIWRCAPLRTGAARRAHLAKSRRQPRRPCAAAFRLSGRGTRGCRCRGPRRPCPRRTNGVCGGVASSGARPPRSRGRITRRGRCADGAGPNGMARACANRGGDIGQLHDRTSELTEAASVLDRVEEIPPPVDVPASRPTCVWRVGDCIWIA
jgi:hypothetical protein